MRLRMPDDLGLLIPTLLLLLLGLLASCVPAHRYRHDVLRAYKKGLRVGRVIGRDEVLGRLFTPVCFEQNVNELMNPGQFDKEEAPSK